MKLDEYGFDYSDRIIFVISGTNKWQGTLVMKFAGEALNCNREIS
ncbi:hypothetical protein [Edaphocola aurantiacus]|nr:hypothetical protein [Edaphocola aurantiacus]